MLPRRGDGAPLAAPFVTSPRPEATIRLPPDATLVLFSDGLVERRTTDIDEGLERLRDAVRRHAPAPAEVLAQTLVEELLPGEADDDVALVVLRLGPAFRSGGARSPGSRP